MSEGFGPGAAFDVFAKRARSGVLTKAVIGYVLISIVVGAIFVALTWSQLLVLMNTYVATIQASISGEAPPTDMNDPRIAGFLNAFLSVAPWLFVLQFVGYLLLAALETACYRWLIHGDEGRGFLGLTLGADTWRVYLTYWLWLVVGIVIYIAFVILIVLVAAIGGGIAAAAPDASAASGLIILVGVLIAGLACLYVVLRLAPAAATSVGRRRFAYFDAWRVTQGRFFSMLGAYFILFVLFVVVYALFAGVSAAVLLGPLAGLISTGAAPDPAAVFAAILNPATLGALIVAQIAFAAVIFVLFLAAFGINARAVRVALQEGRIEAPATA